METTKAEKAFLNKKEAKDGESLIRSQPNRLEPSCVIDRHLAFFWHWHGWSLDGEIGPRLAQADPAETVSGFRPTVLCCLFLQKMSSLPLSFPFTTQPPVFFQANSAKLEALQTSRALIRRAAAVTELDQNVSVAGLGITPAPQYFAAQFG